MTFTLADTGQVSALWVFGNIIKILAIADLTRAHNVREISLQKLLKVEKFTHS